MNDHKYVRLKEKKKRERHNCSVPQCSALKNSENHLHRIPMDFARRKQWAIALKTGKSLTDNMRVCSSHFKPEDYITTLGAGLRPNLKRTAVPSQNLPIRSLDKGISSPIKRKNDARSLRLETRTLRTNEAQKEINENEIYSLSDDEYSREDFSMASISEKKDDWVDMDIDSADAAKFKDVGIQVNVEDANSGLISSILSNDKKLFSATGLHSVKLLNTLTSCFKSIAAESPLKNFLLSTRDKILLTMVKIKLAISFSSLAILFDINIQTCSNYFYDTVVILAQILKSMVFWPTKEDILKNMPKCFSKFKNTRVVLDCYEIPIEKMKCISCRVRSYSHYKKNFTAKLAMIVTPSGLICHSCTAFGGRASDKVITKHSGVYELCDPSDGIMVDKGYDIDEEWRDNLLTLIRPPFLRKKKF